MWIETYEEFEERMGVPFIRDERGITFFVNGATSNGYQHLEPPKDRLSSWENQAVAYRLMLRRTTDAFARLRECALDESGTRPLWQWNEETFGKAPDAKDEFGNRCNKAALARLMEIAKAQRNVLENIQEKIAATPEKQKESNRWVEQQMHNTKLEEIAAAKRADIQQMQL